MRNNSFARAAAFYLVTQSLFALILCSSPAAADTSTIAFNFPVPSPNTITINAGDSIRFNGPSFTHPLQQVTGSSSDTPTSGGFSSTSSPFTVQFDTPGTYFYRCTNHGVAAQNGTMRGSITVVAGGSATPTPNPDPDPTATPIPGCDTKPDAAVLVSPANNASLKKTRVSLNWDDELCASNYKVTVRKDKKSGTIVDQKTVTRSSYKTVALTKGSTYFWNVKNCNSFGCTGSKTFKFSLK